MMRDRGAGDWIVAQSDLAGEPVYPLREVTGNVSGRWRRERGPADRDRDRAQLAGLRINLVHHQLMQRLHGFNRDGAPNKL